MSDLQLLDQLQAIDLLVEAKNTALQQIESTLGETGELATARAQVDSLRGLLHDQEQRLRELEWDVDEINRHVSAEQKLLFSGSVKNPKELEGLQKDLKQRETKRSQVEDRELQLLADIETTQDEVQRAQNELKRVTESWEDRQRQLSGQQSSVSEELEALRLSRVKIVASLEPTNISLYERLRREKRGRAVAHVERSTCQGCRIALPMGVVQRARAGREFVFCPSCGRLLYAR